MKSSTITIILLAMAVILLGIVLFFNIYEPLSYLDNPLVGNGLGKLCSSGEDCRNFCNNNMGRCNNYCQENSGNLLCDKLFG
ncbi:hypothetical protein HYT23_06560 [Candidatus Pacearchaeota archaeon]|nr:hypothetical protein [Candidatus Pacearchaeota archaeon]